MAFLPDPPHVIQRMQTITITISGPRMAGKSTTAALIEEALTLLGLPVALHDGSTRALQRKNYKNKKVYLQQGRALIARGALPDWRGGALNDVVIVTKDDPEAPF